MNQHLHPSRRLARSPVKVLSKILYCSL